MLSIYVSNTLKIRIKSVSLFLKIYPMAILKVIEVLSSSEKSWEDATRKAIAQAAKSLKNIRSAYVQDQSAVVKDGDVLEFRVNLKITFELE